MTIAKKLGLPRGSRHRIRFVFEPETSQIIEEEGYDQIYISDLEGDWPLLFMVARERAAPYDNMPLHRAIAVDFESMCDQLEVYREDMEYWELLQKCRTPHQEISESNLVTFGRLLAFGSTARSTVLVRNILSALFEMEYVDVPPLRSILFAFLGLCDGLDDFRAHLALGLVYRAFRHLHIREPRFCFELGCLMMDLVACSPAAGARLEKETRAVRKWMEGHGYSYVSPLAMESAQGEETQSVRAC
eukprot:TRINITY_DN1038_c0_g1_i4.p2 TRINITY_DN1038_c0_g1~~TRINITY_DN1038_c0_g1_i4.p2  ORF type:complete len:246 (-),score=62.68 TRINITY_DN1038_c0_g1_i4:189-926(-)